MEKCFKGSQERKSDIIAEDLLRSKIDIGLNDLEGLGNTIGCGLEYREKRRDEGENLGRSWGRSLHQYGSPQVQRFFQEIDQSFLQEMSNRNSLKRMEAQRTEPGSTEFWIKGRIIGWYRTDSCFRELINDESSVRIACFIKCSSPELSHSGGNSERIWSEKGPI
jgi:hypothetical protein